MKLISMKLENFEGVKSLEFAPNGGSMSVYGENGTGKTTIADAQTWLLFDKDSSFTPRFCPKMRDTNGEEIHGIDCTVQAVYEINGAHVSLRKTLREDWKKKRGSSQAVFSGNKTSYFIDDVPKQEKEFSEYISSIADPQEFMILTVPEYFASVLDVKKRRPMLMQLAGGVGDFDVIGSSEELKPLMHLLLKPGTAQMWYSIEEFQKICRSRRTAANDALKELPGRIDEVSRQISAEQTDVTAGEVTAAAAKLNAERAELSRKLNASSAEKTAALREDIADKSRILAEMKAARAEENRRANDAVMARISKLTDEKYRITNALSVAKAEKIQHTAEAEKLAHMRDELLAEYAAVSAEKWSGDTVCPCCGQDIPPERIAEAKTGFETQRRRRLEELNARGKAACSKPMIAEAQSAAEKAEEKISSLQKSLEDNERSAAEAEKELIVADPLEQTPEYMAVNNLIEGMRAQIKIIENGGENGREELRRRIAEIDEEAGRLAAKLAALENCRRLKDRLAELEAEQKQAEEESEKAQQGLYLCEQFSRAKADMLTEKINAKFEKVRFKLFRRQVNGGIEDICEALAPTANGYIPYSTANNAARINAGLDIIRTFSKALGLELPVFVDNAESVTKLEAEGMQVIRLVVSENDKTLRFETEE